MTTKEALDALWIGWKTNEAYDTIKSALNRLEELEKDFEWLKSKLNLTFLDSLGFPEDKIKLAKIMGYEIEGY